MEQDKQDEQEEEEEDEDVFLDANPTQSGQSVFDRR